MYSKKQIISIMLLMAALTVGGMAMEIEAQAAAKVSLKGSTLTISGKGAMPKKLKVKNKKKIKKVVIKKGVTTISNEAFENYKNLKSVTIPKTVKKIGWSSFYGTAIKKLTIPTSVKSIGELAFNGMNKLKKLTVPGNFTVEHKPGDETWYSVCNNVGTVQFNTKLNLERTALFTTNNFIVKKDDPNYQSIDGVIYSKNGKSIVRVPFLKKELNIVEGCEEFNLQSVLYVSQDAEGDPEGGCQVEKITIPSSVKTVESQKYFERDSRKGDFGAGANPTITLDIRTKQLDGMSINELQKYLDIDVKTMMSLLPEQIRYENDMYLTSDGVLLKYTGNTKELTVPSGVKKIGCHVFSYYCRTNQPIEKITLPEGLTEIGEMAFYYCSDVVGKGELVVNFPSTLTTLGDYTFAGNAIKKLTLPDTITSYGKFVFADNTITEVTLPGNMKEIPAGLCDGCQYLEKIVIPDSVETVGYRAFSDCVGATQVQFGKSVKVIEAGAFMGVKFTELTVPATVEKVNAGAFVNRWKGPENRSITIQCSSKNIANDVFNEGDTLIYTKSPNEFRTFFDTMYASFDGKKIKVPFKWNKVSGADGYKAVFATDKNFKKNKKTLTLKKDQSKTTVSLPRKKSAKVVYGKIRPYKNVDGKRVYGRWTVMEFECM